MDASRFIKVSTSMYVCNEKLLCLSLTHRPTFQRCYIKSIMNVKEDFDKYYFTSVVNSDDNVPKNIRHNPDNDIPMISRHNSDTDIGNRWSADEPLTEHDYSNKVIVVEEHHEGNSFYKSQYCNNGVAFTVVRQNIN